MKVQTEYGEQELDEVIRCYNLWKKMMAKNIGRKNEWNQTDEGKNKNRQNAKSYYQRHKEEILAKRKASYVSKKDKPQFIDG